MSDLRFFIANRKYQISNAEVCDATAAAMKTHCWPNKKPPIKNNELKGGVSQYQIFKLAHYHIINSPASIKFSNRHIIPLIPPLFLSFAPAFNG